MLKTRKKPTLSTPFYEAVEILCSWSSKVGATKVEARVVAGIPKLVAVKGSETVGVLSWDNSRKWHVAVGFGSWSVLPRSKDWTRESLDVECLKATKWYKDFPVDATLNLVSNSVNANQEVLDV